MRFSARLRFGRVVSVLSAAVVMTAAVTVAAAAPATADEAFYTPPSPLPAGQNGDVIKSQPSAFNGGKATRIMYLSRDTKDKAIPVTGTVIVPTAPWTGQGPRPIVAYAPFTSGMGDKCAVSKTIAGEGSADIIANVQTQFVNALLQKGFAVAQTDYEGLGTPNMEHTYVMRRSEAHTTLDVVRAAQRLPDSGLDKNAPIGIVGYSQGGGASAAAVEMAPDYAPELDLNGAYAGAAPADKAVLAKSLDGAYAAGFLGFALIGINTAYPETHMLDLANPTGAQLFLQARQICTMDAIFQLAFKQTNTLTKDGRPVSAYLSEEPFKSVVEDLKIGNLKPAAPVLVEHTPMDDIVPYPQGKQMAKDWCGKGANVEFKDLPSFSPVLSHALAAFGASGNAANWIADRLAGKPATSNCGAF
ncbi:lipase family protein [Amycolatopsis sp. NPDC059027]|uniref:lipase family protein n=1 Tax=unclassified Amycolatopsis TaxID=2618356 RepID=UPI00366BDCB0